MLKVSQEKVLSYSDFDALEILDRLLKKEHTKLPK